MSKKISSDIKETIANYIKYDNHIREQESKIKKIKKERDILSNDILNYMINNKLSSSDIRVGDSKLRYHENKSMSSLNQKYIKQKLEEYFLEKHSNMGEQKCIAIANSVYDYIISSRKYKKKIILKRIFN